MSRPPVKVNQQFFSLSSVGVQQQYFNVKNIGFPSERGIGVADQGPVSESATLVNPLGRNQAFCLRGLQEQLQRDAQQHPHWRRIAPP